ncbi:hypothetical protein BGX26_005792, partial [Mortierella sp. AD094]
ISALQARLDAVPSNNPYIVDTAPSKEIIPDDNLIAAMPSISGENFFSRPTGDNHNLTVDRANFPRNSLQSYKAPPVSELPWPANASEAQQMDKTLQSIQEHLARITRPLDTFATTVFTSSADDAIKSEVLDFLQIMRSQIADVAHIISEERQERYFRTRSIKAKPKDGSSPLISTEQFSARNKESDLAKEAMGSKPKENSKQRGKGRGQYGGFRSGGFGWQPQAVYPQQFQQQYAQQQQQQQQYQYGQPQPAPMVYAIPGQGFSPSGYQGQNFTRGGRGRGRGRPQTQTTNP